MTARDVIAKTICKAVGPECDCAGGAESYCIYYRAADVLLKDNPLRLELAAALNPKLTELVSKQADDPKCWELGATEREKYLQQRIRLLHAAIEGTDFFGFPLPSPPSEEDALATLPLITKEQAIQQRRGRPTPSEDVK